MLSFLWNDLLQSFYSAAMRLTTKQNMHKIFNVLVSVLLSEQNLSPGEAYVMGWRENCNGRLAALGTGYGC